MRSPNFVFGVATSSFQIEGGAESRLPCIWDTFCATEGNIRDHSDGRVACDHVSRWEEDVDLMASIGVDAYRFSISWPRLITLDGRLNEKGAGFYLKMLDRLNERGIKPFVTLYHWDLPQHLEDAGGWLNRDTAFRFRDYVDLASRALGERVHAYATLNEPQCSAHLGYGTGVHAPGRRGRPLARKAAHHLLLGHGLAMEVLERNSPDTENGIVLNFAPCYPASDSAEDAAAARLADQVHNQWYIQPLLQGRYPHLLDELSPEEAPDLRDGDLGIIQHPIDFLGVNYYTRSIVRADRAEGFAHVEAAGAPLTDMGWEIFPRGLTDLLLQLDRKYDLPPVYITENGAAMVDRLQEGAVQDPDRVRYIQDHLQAVHEAIEHGVDVRGYFCWSLMDNFEWAEGYTKRFGIVYVDYSTQSRTVKASGRAYGDMLRSRARAG